MKHIYEKQTASQTCSLKRIAMLSSIRDFISLKSTLKETMPTVPTLTFPII